MYMNLYNPLSSSRVCMFHRVYYGFKGELKHSNMYPINSNISRTRLLKILSKQTETVLLKLDILSDFQNLTDLT